MRSAPKWTEFTKYPVNAGISILAIGTTAAWWSKVDISPLFETAMIRRGQLWRLVTCALPHNDILHLVFNIYWFWIFGTIVEEVYSHLRTAALIFLLAAASGAMEFAFADGGVGLSGVGYGLFSLLWVLSSRDDRFRDAVDQRTVQLFVIWFVFCIITTIAKVFAVANIAHATGAVLGLLVGVAIAAPSRRMMVAAAIVVLLAVALWGATVGRPRINLSSRAGYEEGKWGYEALMEGRDKEAARWLADAATYRPELPIYWFDLGIANQRLGKDKAAQAAYQKAHELEPSNDKYSEAAKSSP